MEKKKKGGKPTMKLSSPNSSSSNSGGGIDRISGLPDELRAHILSFLPTKYAVGTSILSSRWTRIWVSVPVLDFDPYDHRTPNPNPNHQTKKSFCNFVDKVLSVNNSPNVSKFRLRDYPCRRLKHLARVNSWICSAIMRNVVQIDIKVLGYNAKDSNFRLRFLPCQSLEVLTIDTPYALDMPTGTSSSCFGNLRVLRIHSWNPHNSLAEKFFTGLPLLEELSICGDINEYERKPLTIVAPALKSLELILILWDPDTEIVIDAPRLEEIRLWDTVLLSYVVKDPPCNISDAIIDVGSVYFAEQDFARDDGVNYAAIELVRGVCNAKSLTLSAGIVMALSFAQDYNPPTFHFLKRLLLVVLDSRGWNLLPYFLQSAPYLETLIVTKKEDIKESNLQGGFVWTTPNSSPTCLVLHHNKIQIRYLEQRREERVEEADSDDEILCKKLTYSVRNCGSSVS